MKIHQRNQMIVEIKELALEYWGMNLQGGSFEEHLKKILDNYIELDYATLEDEEDSLYFMW